jgi:hypothetical protein
MSSANVNSIQAIADMKAALAVFVDQAGGALEEVDLEIRRMLDWVLNEQPPYWQRQIRECEERVTQARIDLQRCRMFRATDDHVPDCAEQKVALRKAELRLEDAHDKLKRVREWGRQLPTVIDEYLAQAQQLGAYLVDDLSRGTSTLERMTQALEAYASVAPTAQEPASAGWGGADSESVAKETNKESALDSQGAETETTQSAD